MVEKTYDAIIIGSGHNGLVAATYLSRAGFSVLVLEGNERLGGATSSEEILPGYWVDTGSFDASLFSQEIVTEFGLRKQNLRFIESPILAFAPQIDDISLNLWRDNPRNRSEIARFSKRDAEKFSLFQELLSGISGILRSVIHQPPPPIKDFHVDEITSWIRIALDTKRLGNDKMMEVLRILPMPIGDLLDEWFETPLLKGLFGRLGVTGLMLGPSAPGTTFMFLYNSLGTHPGIYPSSSFVRGGMSNLVKALASEAQGRGAEILTGKRVSKVLIEGDRARGVSLENGDSFKGKTVLSNVNPRETFFELVGAKHLEVSFLRELKNIRYRGTIARLIFGLSDLPRFRSAIFRESEVKEGSLLSGHIVICPDLSYLERAYDDAKYGRTSDQPVMEIVIPTVLDPSRAPKGKHLMLVNAQYAPRNLEMGSWETEQNAFTDRVVNLIESYAPGFSNLIEAQTILTPRDFETRFGLPDGCIHHGQMTLDQLLFMRPVPGYSNYRTPVDGLYLCGAGTHPGGGVTGLPGYHAARQVVKDLPRGG